MSRRAEPPALILASRRSRRRRFCFWAADSPDVLSWLSILNFERKEKGAFEMGVRKRENEGEELVEMIIRMVGRCG